MNFLTTIKPKYFFLVLPILFSTGFSFAQIKNQEFQTWNDAILTYTFNDKLSHVGDLGARYYFDTHWIVFYARPALKWSITKDLSFTGGVATFCNSNKDFDNVSDLRIFQEMGLVWPRLKGFSFHHRLMVEERWFLTESQPAEYKVRGRYRLGLLTPHYKLIGKHKTIYNELLIEFLDNLDKNNFSPFDNFERYTFVIGNDFSRQVGLELHYQVHSILLNNGIDIQQNIIRIRVKLNLNAL